MDYTLYWLLTQSAGAFADPMEFREKLIEFLYSPLDEEAMQMEFDEIEAKGGNVIRVPKVDRNTKLAPVTPASIADVTPAKARDFKALLDKGLGAI